MFGSSKPSDVLPELIDDRAITRHDQDRLRHSGFARELAELVRTVTAPANIALFGSWGAGKSGLGKLLCGELDRKDGIRCVVYDAFKYADFPLRRDFISQVAHGLEIDDDAFHDGLYRETTTTNLSFNVGKLTRLIVIFLIAAIVGLCVFVAFAFVVSEVLPGSAHGDFKTILNSGTVLLVTPAALLTAFVAMANRSIPVDHNRSEPASEEEFEKTFRKLIVKAKAKKLVIFIDELDRCSSEEVVSTLASVRTFLDVDGCVCIVAADQAVLERALSKSLVQATPINRANPYYSSGSEYLDKVFQYQLPVPALMPRRLSGFALRLIKGHGGVWTEVDHDKVISALIPVHIRSPRRVKTLLNAFVIAYRLAALRHEEGALHTPPRQRAAEIAKLVCLRHEFPLFAEELIVDARMPDYVLQVAQELREGASDKEAAAQRPPQVRIDVWERAVEYATETSDVDVMLPDVSDDEEAEGPIADARRRHGSLLIAYLQGNERVPGPARDLVHLESGGAAYGLSPAFADQLEEEAVAGISGDVVEQIVALDDTTQRQSALRMLAHRALEAETSGERLNVMAALTAAAVTIADAPAENDSEPVEADDAE